MISWPLLSLIIVVNLILVLGTVSYLYHLPGYDRNMYMEGIGVETQRRIKMSVAAKCFGMVGIILGLAFLLIIFLGGIIPDPETLTKTDLAEGVKITEMKNGTSFVIMTEECVWIYESDVINEIVVNLRAIARKTDYYTNPKLVVMSSNTMLGSTSTDNRLILELKNPDNSHVISDPALNLQTE